jgi:hypothetical protein
VEDIFYPGSQTIGKVRKALIMLKDVWVSKQISMKKKV